MAAASKPASLKVRALKWLAQREHSPAELRAKLMRLLECGSPGIGAVRLPSAPARETAETDRTTARSEVCPLRSPTNSASLQDAKAEVDAVMEWLSERGYLSEQRFVESRVHARQARFGNLRITRELQQHGVVLDAAAQEALRASEYERARDVWQRKYGDEGAPQDAASRVRQMRFLTGRGFSPETIRRVLRPVATDD